MGMPGLTELIIILSVVVLLFGAKQLPKLGGSIGESIKNFRKGIKDSEKKSLPDNDTDTDNNKQT